jgi:hypothetical protein
MNFRRPHLFFRSLPVLGAASMILLATGCWDEEGGTPTPTPTPTPNPTATPTPTPSPTPSPTPLTSSTTATSGDVVLANADIVETAAADSVKELLAVEKVLSGGDLTGNTVASARSSLANAREAFHLVEASLYYSDPGNTAELTALPPELVTQLPSLAIPEFAELEFLLSQHSAGDPAPELLAAAQSLRSQLEVLAAAWAPHSLENFRNTFFLPDPDAPARILQGLAATTDLLVLSGLAPETQDQILPRLWTVKDLLEGTYESFDGRTISGTGLIVLIEEKDAAAARQLLALVDSLIVRHDSPGAGASGSLETLRDEILAAARTLGYELEPAGNSALQAAGD